MSDRDFSEKDQASTRSDSPEDSDPGGSSGESHELWLATPSSDGQPFESDTARAELEVFDAELVGEPSIPTGPRAGPPNGLLRRRRFLPLMLFLLTCVSTLLAGACRWVPFEYVLAPAFGQDMMPLRRVLVSHWQDGVIYMVCVLAILLTHEMGHFLATLWHRIPASFPYFLPLPISPVGTLGAVIGMDGLRANRRQMFDIGIAGPLAGLVVAVPVLWIGVAQLDFSVERYGMFQLDNPLVVSMLLDAIQPRGYSPGDLVWHAQLNPYFMAGWVGLLITGLNMMPVSQLDGGHVTYTLFGRKAHWIARGLVLFAVAWMFYSGTRQMLIMILLILLVGTDHPPTSNDNMPLGWFRTTLGYLSLSIPILCFAPRLFILE